MNRTISPEIAAEFGQARIKHLLFKSKLRGYLYGSHSEKQPLIDHNACALGKWLLMMAEKYDISQEIQEVNYHHQNIHAVATKLVTIYDSGDPEKARAGFLEIEDVATEMLASLDELEKQIS